MGKRILVVEDEDTLRHVITQVLSEDGHQVTGAARAEEGLELFSQEPFPVVITDIVLGGMNGIELLAEISRIQPESRVVIMTSHASLETAQLAVRSGAFDYLIKPFDDLEIISDVTRRAVQDAERIEENRALVEGLKRSTDELERSNRDLQQLASRDGLTGLYNRRHFEEVFEMETARCRRYGRPFSVLFLDVDHFKEYNDRHGHPAGDRVLKELAEILRGLTRRSDVVARYGGEEFVIITAEVRKEGALTFAESVRRSVSTFPFQGRETQPRGCVTVSIGVASFPEDGTDARALLEKADQNLYKVKKRGRNGVVG